MQPALKTFGANWNSDCDPSSYPASVTEFTNASLAEKAQILTTATQKKNHRKHSYKSAGCSSHNGVNSINGFRTV